MSATETEASENESKALGALAWEYGLIIGKTRGIVCPLMRMMNFWFSLAQCTVTMIPKACGKLDMT